MKRTRLLILSPVPDKFDMTVHRILTKSKSVRNWKKPENKDQYRICKNYFDFVNESNSEYGMDLRILRFKISETAYENIVTNLPADFSPATIKKLYEMRWKIETSFCTLKHNLGATTLHSKNTNISCRKSGQEWSCITSVPK